MTPTQQHILFNHMPLFSTLFGVLVLAAGLLMKQSGVRRVAYVILIVGGIVAFPALSTGEEAHHYIERAGVYFNHDIMHEHEEAAEGLIWLTSILGLLGLAGLYLEWKKHTFVQFLGYLVIGFGAYTLYSTSHVNHLGGQIRRQELQEGYEKPEGGTHEHDEHGQDDHGQEGEDEASDD